MLADIAFTIIMVPWITIALIAAIHGERWRTTIARIANGQ